MTESWEFGEPQEPDAAETGSDTGPSSFPWPPAEGAPVLAALGETWKGATLEPTAFFQRTPRSGGTGAALLYYLGIGILVAGASLFWNSLSLLSGPAAQDPLAAELGIASLSPIVGFLLSPALLLGGLLLGAGVTHVLLLLFNGASGGFGTTVRVYCYASSPSIFGVVPLLGTLVGWVWGIVLLIIGLREAHEAAAWKPLVAVLLPMLVAMGLFALLIVAAVLAVGTGLGG